MNAHRIATIVLYSACWSDQTALAAGCPCSSGPQTLDVYTSIGLSCLVTTTPLVFGNYDPISANATSPLDSTGGLSLTCTDGYNATVRLDQGAYPLAGSTDAAPLRRMSDGGNSRLQYALYQDAARTIVWGGTNDTATCTSGNVIVYGRVDGGQNVPVGTYNDVVVVTVDI